MNWASLAARMVDTETQMLVVILRLMRLFLAQYCILKRHAGKGRQLEHLGHGVSGPEFSRCP